MTAYLLTPIAVLIAYTTFVAVRLGLHQRLPLALGPISLERILDRAASRYGERVLFTTDHPVTWSVPALRHQYDDPTAWSAGRIRSTAGYISTLLRDRFGVRRGDRVAVLKTNHLDVHVLAAGIVRAGGVACPINDRFRAGKLSPYLLNIGARILITDSRTLRRVVDQGGGLGKVEVVILTDRSGEPGSIIPPGGQELVWLEEELEGVEDEGAAVPRGRDEPLYLVHSSGTTGFPKAVILKNGPQSHAVRGWLCYVHVSRRLDRGYLAVPNNHQAVILSFNSLLLLGMRVHWIEAYDRERFDAAEAVRQLADGGYTGFFGFPVTYTRIKELDLGEFDLSRIHFWAATADASHEVVERACVAVGSTFRRLGIPVSGSTFLDAQGSSEVGTPSVIRYVTPFTRRFDRRIGRPGSSPFGPKIRVVCADRTTPAASAPGSSPSAAPVVRHDGRLARPGEVGRLLVRGKTVFDGYWNHHALTYAAIHDGWFFTGDVVRRGRDGHLHQLDREVDVIRTRTGDVYSLPMEEVIHKHPAVFDVCVYGARQDDGSQLPAAAVALRDGFHPSEQRLLLELNERLHPEAQLSALVILPWSDFPMGVTGKTLKRVFRERTEPGGVVERNTPIVLQGAEPRGD